MNVSHTRTFNKQHERSNKGFRKQRAHDHLYDPVYTVSGERDHARVSFKAHASVDRVRKVPEFGSMFSHLPHHPRYALRLDSRDPVPAFIDRRWQGYTEQRREALQKLTGVIPGVHYQVRGSEDVSGANRCKFFKRPLIPFAEQVPPGVVFALPKAYSTVEGGNERPLTPFQRTVGVQTDYRDSEAQTDPYSPEYLVRPGTAPPELLTMATLLSGRGLPVGMAEVEMIERVRAKWAWEATLPPLNDLSQLGKRKRMMDEMEWKEWAFREEEIQNLQEGRLVLLKNILRQREEAQQVDTVKRLELKYAQHHRDKESRQQKIRNDYTISLRKLISKRRNVEGKLERRDIIRDYSDYSSQTYAPMSRVGVFPDRHSQRNVVKSHYLNTYEGLLSLEAGLLASETEPCTKAPPKPKTASKGFVKRSERWEMELAKTHQKLKEEKVRVEEKKPLRFLFKTEKPVPRPLTPVVDEPPEGDEERELAVIYLQKLLRGRSIQNQMFEGKQKHRQLIQELRTTHALQREELGLHAHDTQLTLALQRERDLHTHKAKLVEAHQAGVAGTELADMLDFLSKELIRLQEERRIHAFTLLAERDRRIREAEESGRRQVEEKRRREEDEIFRQVVRVHQDTVDLYLEDVILGSVEQTADQQAREEVHRMAQEVNNIAYDLEHTRTSMQSEEIVADLMYSFLVPEVQKISVRARVHQSQSRHLQAAHQIIYGGAGGSTAPPGRLGPPRPSPPPDKASRHLLEEMVRQLLEEMISQVEEEGAASGGQQREG